MSEEWMENKMRRGGTCGCLDCGGMVVDHESGDYVPIDQVLHDPDHIGKLDILDQDAAGCIKLGFVDGGDPFPDADFGDVGDDSHEEPF